jgi:hypothetical protein
MVIEKGFPHDSDIFPITSLTGNPENMK